jgi:hypothetical protein
MSESEKELFIIIRFFHLWFKTFFFSIDEKEKNKKMNLFLSLLVLFFLHLNDQLLLII